jgi:DnaA-homolog protein
MFHSSQNTPQQLSLGVQLRSDAKLSRFVQSQQSALIPALKGLINRQENQSQESFVYLYGRENTGKSYLLQALCNEADLLGISAIYLPLSQTDELSVEMLEGLEHFQLVCLDDVDSVIGDSAWQEALFHLFNRIRGIGHSLLISGVDSPANSQIELQDLRSRLAWGLTFKLEALSDEQKREAIQQEAAARGLVLADEVAQYLLNHGERDLSKQYEYLDQLDRASLQAQRKLTIPFAKQVLGWL